MKKQILCLAAIGAGFTAHAQLKVGDNPTVINVNSALEVESTNKGLLIPRVSLTGGTSSPAPLTAHVAGMMVYNTTGIGDARIGFYFNDGAKWVRFADNTQVDLSKDGWVDNVMLSRVEIPNKISGAPRVPGAEIVIQDNSNVGFGTATPSNRLTVVDAANPLKLVGLVNGTITDSYLTVDANGVVRKGAAPSTTTISANNGLTRNVDSVQLGGALTKQTTITTDATNNLVVNAAAIGGNNIEDEQGLNVLATSVNNATAKAVALRGRIAQGSGSIKEARGVSGAATLTGGTVTGTATGGYFNTNMSGTTLNNGVSITGVAADVEATAATNVLAGENNLIGARFGANAANASSARAIGVQGQANAGDKNIGVLGAANTSDAQLKTALNAIPSNMSAGVTAINATNGPNDRAIYSDGKVQLLNTPSGAVSDNVVTIDATGNVRQQSLTSLGGAVTADNGLTKTGNNVQLGGALIQPTTVTTTGANNLVVNATGIGGSNVEDNQGLNVLATSINSASAKAVALRGRVSQSTGAIGQARGVSGAANITGGTVAGTATGAYFNTAISGTTLPATNGLMTGVAADAEATGANTNGANNTFAGARFGADVASAPTTHGAGVIATAVGSTASNVGIAASTTTDAATLTGKVNALPAGTNAANYSYAPTGANNFANYTDGNVRMENLGATTPTQLVGIDAAGNLSTTAMTASTLANNGLTKVADSVQLGGALTKQTTITSDAANNLVIDAAAIGGNNVEDNQGLNVLATSINSASAKAVALRGRVSQSTGAIGQARGVSGAANITGGNVAGTATGGYFNTYVAGSTVANGGLITGVAADAEAGANSGITTATNNTFAGARFGSDVGTTTQARSAGVVATAVGSANANIGVAASTTTDAATLTGKVNALTPGTNAANYSYAPTGANNFANYTDGNVRMENLGATTPTQLVGIDAAGNLSTTAMAASTLANNGLTKVADSVQLGGALTKQTTITSDAANNLVIQANNIGGASSEVGQGLNVLSTATSSNFNASALRGRVQQTAGTVDQLRGVTGVATSNGGTVSSSSNGGYFSNQLAGGALGTGAVMSAVSGDVEATAGTANASNAMIGGRFGSALSGTVAGGRAIGVLATAGGSSTANVGALSVVNDATLTSPNLVNLATSVGGANNGAAVAAINPTTTANNFALYSDGNVAMKNLGSVATADTLLSTDANGNVRKVASSALAADLRLVNGSSHITQDGGVGSNGTSAGAANVIAIGAGAGNANTAVQNTFIGSQAGLNNVSATNNTMIGFNAGLRNTGASNTMVGSFAGQQQSTGVQNTALGQEALFGDQFGAGGTGSENTALGFAVMQPNSSGGQNTGAGTKSMNKNTTGSLNAAYGYQSSFKNTTGIANTSIGANAGYNTTTAASNTSIGAGALFANTTGAENTSLGQQAGANITTGSRNLNIGFQASAASPSGSNQMNIGNIIYGTAIDGAGATLSTGNVGIGNNAPTNKLHVTAAANPLRLQGLQAGDSTDNYLSVDANGVVRSVAVPAAPIAVLANNGLTRVADSVQLGGTLTKATDVALNGNNFSISNATNPTALFRNDGSIALGNSTPIYSSNKLEINLKNVGGATTAGEENQGVNILGSTLNNSALSVGLRSRLQVPAGSSVTSARGTQSNMNIEGTLNGGAGAIFFNSNVASGATLGTNASITGISGDAGSATGAPAGAATNSFTGARFGANALNTPNATALGVGASAIGSVTSNTAVNATAIIGTATTNSGVVAAVGQFPAIVAQTNAATSGRNAAIVAVNPNAAGTGTTERAIYSTGGVQLENLGTTTATQLVGIDADGNLSKAALAATTTADNGLTKTLDNVQLGGALTQQTTITSDATNNLVVNAAAIGGSNVEDNQGLNVLATSINSSTAKAVALRGRISQTAGEIGQARGVSGAANITGGTVNGTATGAYFNTAISGTTLPATNGIMTGVAADAEATGTNTNGANNTFAGARFGSDVGAAPTTHGAGVIATAVGSTATNVGIAASTTTDAATLTGKVNALPAGTNVANYSYAPGGPTNFATYSDGNVVMKNLSTGVASSSLLVIDGTGEVKKITGAAIIAGVGLDATNDAWVNATGRVQLGTLANGTTARPAGTEVVATDAGRLGLGVIAPTNKLHVVDTANPLRLEGLQAGATTDQLLSVDANGVVRKTTVAAADLRLVGTGNHISQDAGVGSNGTSAGTGYSNIIIGNGNASYPAAGNSMTNGYRNIFLGETVGNANTAGYRNTIVGAPSFTANTTGNANTAFGNSTLRFSNGDFNTVLGAYTMNQNTTGSENTAIGANALYENKTGIRNTALGWRALGGAAGGSSNIGIGYNTGINVGGSNNIIIGNTLDIQNTAASNQLNIGNLIYGTGVDGAGTTISSGNVGIGVKAPARRLHVANPGGTAATTSMRIEGVPTYATDAAAGTGGLTTGDVYKTVDTVNGGFFLKIKG